MLAYNGSIPGPMLKIPQGAEITVNFTNNTDMPTLLHSHGVRMDNAFDGSQSSQSEIKPGETFSYKLKFPDVGMFWYHPHVREDYEQELGLYGNYLVTPSDTTYWSPINKEVALFLDDILIENNQISLSKQAADHTLMGRYGNVMLINGQTDYSLNVKKGDVVRFYLTNAANARPFNFAIENARMKLVGADNGAYEKDQWKDSVALAPSERAVVEALFDKSGRYAIQNKTPDRTYALGDIYVSDENTDISYAKDFNQLKNHLEVIQSIDAFRSSFNKTPDKQIKLSMTMSGNMMNMPGMGHQGHMMPDGTWMGGSMMQVSPDGIEWDDTNQMMNQMSTKDSVQWKIIDQQTGKMGMDIDWTFAKGQPVKIRIFNDPNSMHPMQHPIHFHGQRFLVLSDNGVSQTDFAWKDTVMVPSGHTVDILLDTSNPGTWMAHCHIAEHLEDGMMLTFKVE
jgi:FtsP/CotA-like multicopper oxidase with cupredoxin domain